MTGLDELGIRVAPPGAYTILVRIGSVWSESPASEDIPIWVIDDIRLFGRSIWDDYDRTHPGVANRYWGQADVGGHHETREAAIKAGVAIAAEHAEQHVWWVPE